MVLKFRAPIQNTLSLVCVHNEFYYSHRRGRKPTYPVEPLTN